MEINKKDYFVRTTMWVEASEKDNTHSFFVTNMSVYNNSINNASVSTSVGARLNVDAISEIEKITSEQASLLEEPNSAQYQSALEIFFSDNKVTHLNQKRNNEFSNTKISSNEYFIKFTDCFHQNFVKRTKRGQNAKRKTALMLIINDLAI